MKSCHDHSHKFQQAGRARKLPFLECKQGSLLTLLVAYVGGKVVDLLIYIIYIREFSKGLEWSIQLNSNTEIETHYYFTELRGSVAHPRYNLLTELRGSPVFEVLKESYT